MLRAETDNCFLPSASTKKFLKEVQARFTGLNKIYNSQEFNLIKKGSVIQERAISSDFGTKEEREKFLGKELRKLMESEFQNKKVKNSIEKFFGKKKRQIKEKIIILKKKSD